MTEHVEQRCPFCFRAVVEREFCDEDCERLMVDWLKQEVEQCSHEK